MGSLERVTVVRTVLAFLEDFAAFFTSTLGVAFAGDLDVFAA
jgi:hypothetical protein